MDTFEKVREFATSIGYERAYGEESDSGFGLFILVKMKGRKIVDEDDFYKPARQIRKDIETVSAKLDPEGPAKRERCRAEIAGIYSAAGVGVIYMEELPNRHCPDPCCLNTPWFRVTSKIGHVVIGRQRSVISIDWKDSTVKKTGEELFPEEKVTRWDVGIHAYGMGAVTRYIRRLHEEEK